jgi:hypothetical protein
MSGYSDESRAATKKILTEWIDHVDEYAEGVDATPVYAAVLHCGADWKTGLSDISIYAGDSQKFMDYERERTIEAINEAMKADVGFLQRKIWVPFFAFDAALITAGILIGKYIIS